MYIMSRFELNMSLWVKLDKFGFANHCIIYTIYFSCSCLYTMHQYFWNWGCDNEVNLESEPVRNRVFALRQNLTLNFCMLWFTVRGNLCLHPCVSELVCAHLVETSIQDKAGWKWHIHSRTQQHRALLSHQWPAYRSQSISSYSIIMRFTSIFPSPNPITLKDYNVI